MLGVEFRYLKKIDFLLLLTMFTLIALGFLMIYSATQSDNFDSFLGNIYIQRQMSGFLLGLLIMFAVLTVDYRALKKWAPLFYVTSIAILGFVVVRGEVIHGVQRWLTLGPFNIQPAEVAKILYILSCAAFVDRYKDLMTKFYGFLLTLIFMVIPVLLVLIQPDLGTSIIFVAITFSILFYGGTRPLYLVMTILIILLIIFTAFYLHYNYNFPLPLRDYQINRLMVFVNPDFDPMGAGYNLRQSKIAIGSGGIFGQGLFQGSQSQLRFIPAQHTDFIFSVLGEELGFLGSLFMIFLFYYISKRILMIINRAKDNFGALISAGILALFIAHVVVNVGMTVGIMPVTGLPLPFISYGGSFLLVNMVAVALLLNINMRRHKILFK